MKSLVFSVTVVALLLASPAHAQETEWETVAEFSGNGQKNTAPFTIEGDEWRVVWSSRTTTLPTGVGHLFQLFAVRPGEDNYYDNTLANSTGERRASDTSYMYEGGRFYLRVQAANGSWRVKVQVPRSVD
jgi:hypothetical protein